jgi:predicted signal transduction protein with EAL and GGDEF domain
VAIYPHDGEDSEALLRNADGAMYAAKNAGRGRHAFTDPQLSRTLQEQLLLENDLRDALSDVRGGLFLEYQPQVDVVSHEVVGREALIRWQHPTLGRLPPDRFIPLVARSLGLVTRLDHWVLSVNIMPERLSAENCQSNPLNAMLSAHIGQHGDNERLDWLILELTEEGLLSKSTETLKAMKRLRSLGIGLAIDDFGVGYSNFSHVAQLPVTQVKLDRSLIHRLDELPHNQVLVEGLGGMLQKLEMSCIAEGVETARVASQLQSLGIHTIQGYHIARPMPASDLESWIVQFA